MGSAKTVCSPGRTGCNDDVVDARRKDVISTEFTFAKDLDVGHLFYLLQTVIPHPNPFDEAG